MSKARLKVSNHAKERILERYGFKCDPELINKLSNKKTYKIVSMSKTGIQVREISHNGLVIQAVVSQVLSVTDIVMSFIPETFATDPYEGEEIKLTKGQLRNNEMLKNQRKVQSLSMKLISDNKRLYKVGFFKGFKYWVEEYKKNNRKYK